MMDLNRSFDRMLKRWGYWNALRKLLRDEPRSADFDALYQESNRTALQELTAGRPYMDVLSKMVKRTVVPGFEKRHEVGMAATPGLFFYLPPNTRPTPQDWVLELAQTRVGRSAEPVRPYDVVHIYNIMDVDEMRMEGGQLIYFRCRVEESNIAGPN